MEKNEQKSLIYPISFQDFKEYKNQQSQKLKQGYNISQFRKIRKLKKILQNTQSKINNRIRLFKKVSDQICRKKDRQNHKTKITETQQLKQSKSHQIFSTRIQTRASRENYQRMNKKEFIHQIKPVKARKQNATDEVDRRNAQTAKQEFRPFFLTNTINIDKIDAKPTKNEAVLQNIENILIQKKQANARDIKLQKQRNRILIEQMRSRQARKKMKSADLIRRNRQRAKQIKDLCQNQRIEDARRLKEQKFRTQIQKYDELQSNLSKLKQQQKQALLLWKRAVEK